MMSPDALWAAYESTSLSPSAPRIQRTEMRKAFVAGMFAMLGLMQTMDMDDEDEAAQVLEDYWQDLARRMKAMSPA